MATKICNHCQREFKTYQLRAIFCSWSCFQAGRKQKHPIQVRCEACGKLFYKFPGMHNMKSKRHFCNRACQASWQRKGGNPSGNAHPEYNSRAVHCAECGKTLIREAWRIKKFMLQFCNRKCHGKWRSKNKTAENHPRWRGGHRRYYGPNWGRRSYEARKRDGHKCQICGKPESENGRKLSVHHKIPFVKFGYVLGQNTLYKQANKLRNLVSLCATCHQKVEWGKLTMPISE